MPTPQEVMQDPKFLALPEAEQGIVLQRLDPRFSALPKFEQDKVLTRLKTSRLAPMASAPSESTNPSTMHTLAVAGSGFNEGLARTLGSPVDLVNAGLKALGMPMSQTPVMGSQFIQRYLLPEKTEPKTMGERMVGRVAEEIGATVPFIGGSLVARTKQISEQGTGIVNRMISDLQAIDPDKLAAVESSLAASGGLGAATMNEIFPHGGWMPDFVGEVIGSVGPVAALALVRKAMDGFRAIPSKLGFKSEEELRTDLGEKLTKLGRPSQVEQGMEQAATLEQTIPGFKPTTGQVSDEPGLIQAERTFERSSAEAAQKGATRRKDNQTAIRSSVDEMAPQGKMGDVAPAIEKEQARRTALLEQGTARAQAMVDAQRNLITGRTAQIVQQTEAQMAAADARASQRVDALRNRLTPQQQGAIIRQEYEKELDDYQTAANQRYARVDQSIPLPATNTREAAQSVRQELRMQEADEFVPSGALADMERLGIQQETIQRGPMAKTTTRQIEVPVSFGEFDALKRRLQGEIRAAPNDTVKRRLNIMLDGVERDIDQLADNPVIKAAHPDAAAAYSDARSFARTGIARLKSGQMDAVRQLDKTGREKIGNEDVAQRFLDGQDSLDDFVNAVGSRPAARMALEDAAKTDFYRTAVDPSTGQIHPKAADKWMRDHQAIGEAFPELRSSILDATKAQTFANETRKAGQATLKDPEQMARLSDPAMFDRLDRMEQHAARVAKIVEQTQANWERSAASLFLSDDADRAARRIIGSGTPATKINQVLNQIGHDPIAKRGFERAMWDEALKKFESKALDAMDRPILLGRTGKEFIAENRSWMEPLFSKARMDRLDTAMNAAEMVERSGRVVLPGGSDTSANLQASLSDLGPFLSRLYAHQRGVISLKWILGERVARGIGKQLQKVTDEQAQALLNEAFYNPQVAHTLMLAGKGGNDRLIQQRFRFHLANMNQLSSEESGQENQP